MKTLVALLSFFFLSMAESTGFHRSFLQFFLLSTSVHMIPFVRAENCTLCADGSYPGDPLAKFTYTKNGQSQAITCDMGYTEALKGEFSSCEDLHIRTESICQCGVKNITRSCNLCSLGEELPEPTKKIANETCGAWQAYANKFDFVSNCPAWQKTIGYHCGCKSNSEMSLACPLCKTKPLPDPNRIVTYTDKTTDYCVHVERVLNSQQFPKCEFTQTKYDAVCCSTTTTPGKPSASVPSVLTLSFVWLPSLIVISFLV
jgi:hypothetical protein